MSIIIDIDPNKLFINRISQSVIIIIMEQYYTASGITQRGRGPGDLIRGVEFHLPVHICLGTFVLHQPYNTVQQLL